MCRPSARYELLSHAKAVPIPGLTRSRASAEAVGWTSAQVRSRVRMPDSAHHNVLLAWPWGVRFGVDGSGDVTSW